MSTVHVVLPGGVDDPARPSGGNLYDRRVCDGLRAVGWRVRELPVAGAWPRADAAARRRLASVLGALRDRSIVLLDGIVASSAPEVLLPASARLRLVVLVHLPLGVGGPGPLARAEVHAARGAEHAVLEACRAVVVTSRWTAAWLRVTYALPPAAVAVVPPGTDRAPLAVRSPTGGRLVCVGALTPTKGQDVLVAALDRVRGRDWTCLIVGSTSVDPAFAERVARRVAGAALGERVRFTGALTGDGLAQVRRRTDLLLLPSLAETYGMVVTEALARGVPVVGSDVGGVPESLGHDVLDRRPGILVPPGDPRALAGALHRWLSDPVLRTRCHDAAVLRRADLGRWEGAAAALSEVLSGVAA